MIMIDIPLGEALVPVEDGYCFKCWFYELSDGRCNEMNKNRPACTGAERKDGKNVVFKLADYPNNYERLLNWIKQNSENPPLAKDEIDRLLKGVIK
ncbi:MAG: hypothetical protein LBH43_00620 [Treponema sp.]|jgi:hypothetical protein|nr:hypothetical protein [Treponema sp.]